MANTEIKAKIAELQKEETVQNWLKGLSDRTKDNYLRGILLWNDFIGMTPTQQTQKRLNDTASTNLQDRMVFEYKFREYKAKRQTENPNLSPMTIKSELRTVASLFGRTVGKLKLVRGDWDSQTDNRIKGRFELTLKDVKAMYSHGSLRERCLLLVLAQSGFSEVDVSEFRIEDLKGIYETPISTHYFIEKPREKTGILQATCLSFECVHDIRDLLAERGNPKEGYLFVSQTTEKGKQGIEVRRIHESMKNLAEKALGSEKGQKFQTKLFRSFYNSALLSVFGVGVSELKDIMMGHKRQGARGNYNFDSSSIIEAYSKAFEKLSINGMQNREDLSKIKADLNALIGSQQVQIEQQKQESEQQKQERKADRERIGKLEDFIRANTQTDPNTIKKIVSTLETISSELKAVRNDQREQSLDILQLQDKAKIKPKPLKDTGV